MFIVKRKLRRKKIFRLRAPQKAVLKAVIEAGRFQNTRQISKRATVSWNTARRHLRTFNKKGWIKMRTRGNRKFWKGSVRKKKKKVK